ncbi:MAG: tetratricopeptide repeat protein, partial [Planctomycetota bacterium]
PSGYYFLAFSCMGSKDFQQALEALNEALKRNTKFAEAYILRGEAKLNLNDIPGALLDLQEGIRLQPKNPLSYYLLGSAYLSQKKIEEALSIWEKGLSLNRDPTVLEKMVEIVTAQTSGYFREAKYAEATTSLNRLKPFIYPEHKHYKRIQEMLLEIQKKQK